MHYRDDTNLWQTLQFNFAFNVLVANRDADFLAAFFWRSLHGIVISDFANKSVRRDPAFTDPALKLAVHRAQFLIGAGMMNTCNLNWLCFANLNLVHACP